MTAAIVQFTITALVIVVAGTYLSKFADTIAEKTRLGRLLVGSILLAGATSLPELSVDLSAIRANMPDLAVGDLLGSSLFNLAILAILDLTRRSGGKMLSRQAARHALSGNLSAALIALAAVGLLARPVLASGEWLGVSYGLWLIGLGYLLGVRMIYFDQQVSKEEARAAEGAAGQDRRESLSLAILGFVIAAILIVVAGPFMSSAAGIIADASGLGKTFVGTTLVAASTSLPELVASLAALRLGSLDLAIGNVFGSNAFNMILLIPLDLAHPGPLPAAVSPQHALTCVAAILATLIVVLGQLYHVEKRYRLIEPDALLVLVVITGSLWLMYQLGG